MKIIKFFIFFTVQALSSNNELSSSDNSSIMNDLSLVTQTLNDIDKTNFLGILNNTLISRPDNVDINLSTISPEITLSDTTLNSQTWSSLFTSDYWSFSSFSPMNELDYATSSDANIVKEQEKWLNVDQNHRRDPYKSLLLWRRTSSTSKTYMLTSEPQCIRRICSVELKYNGTLSNSLSGCLSFSIRTHGQPVGQVWISEDDNQYNASKKTEITNKTLHIEHSLKPKLKNLSIETRILFRNPHYDNLILSNLEIDWKGSCPKRHSNSTSSPDIIPHRPTLIDTFKTSTVDDSNISNTLITDDEFEYDQQSSIYEAATTRLNRNTNKNLSFSLLSQKHIRWFLSLISLFCCLIVLCPIGYGVWIIRRQHHFMWNTNFDSKIQFVASRSIRSTARSETNIATISQISHDIPSDNLQKEQTERPTTNSSRSTPISYYTYL